MHQIEIEIVQAQISQALLQAVRWAIMIGTPELAGNEDIAARGNPLRKSPLQTLADFLLVPVAESTVNVSVAGFEGGVHCLGDFARC